MSSGARHHSWAAGRRIRKGRGGSRGGDDRGGRCRVEERARLKGTERDGEREREFKQWKDKTQIMTRGESKKNPVGSVQLITADSLCLDSSPW